MVTSQILAAVDAKPIAGRAPLTCGMDSADKQRDGVAMNSKTDSAAGDFDAAILAAPVVQAHATQSAAEICRPHQRIAPLKQQTL